MDPFFVNFPKTLFKNYSKIVCLAEEADFIYNIHISLIYFQIPSHKVMLNIQKHLVRIKLSVLL